MRKIEALMALFYRIKDGVKQGFCTLCGGLYQYCHNPFARSANNEGKPACAQIAMHCFFAAYRERVRQARHFSGPRMAFTHPMLACRHLLHSLRAALERKKSIQSGT